MCILSFYATFVRNIRHSKKNSTRYHKCAKVFMQSTNYSVKSKMKTWIFQIYVFSKSPLISNITKIRLVGAEVFHADGIRKTDRLKDITILIVAFSKFCHASKKRVARNLKRQTGGRTDNVQNYSHVYSCTVGFNLSALLPGNALAVNIILKWIIGF
jgi:hypothetical protein